MGDRAGAKTIKADVPLSEMFGYVDIKNAFIW
jgi:elongation factor G